MVLGGWRVEGVELLRGRWESKGRLRALQEAQDRPKKLQEIPQVAPRGPGKGRLRDPAGCPKMPQDRPKRPPDRPKINPKEPKASEVSE